MTAFHNHLANIQAAQFASIGLGLAIGMLVGVQRGWVLRDAAEGSRVAGVRTYGLLGLAGAVAGAIHDAAQGPATVLLVAAACLVLFGYYRAAQPGSVSATGSIASLLTLVCGFMVGVGEAILGAAVAVAMVLLLAMRGPLHGWVASLDKGEVQAIARFALISMVILPLLPDKGFGPYQAWNPRQLWLVIVLVSGFSFLGYFSAKLLGASRGILVLAAAGSVVSSTAVTAALAAKLGKEHADEAVLKAGVCVASVVMMARLLVLVAILVPFALEPFALLLAPGLIVSGLPALWNIRRIRTEGQPGSAVLDLRNPLDFRPALVLAMLVMVASLAARWVLAHHGDAGLAVVLAISGSIDADSAIITMGGLPVGAMAPPMAAAVLCIPVILNSLLKAALALGVGGRKDALGMAVPLVTTALMLAGVLVIGWRGVLLA